MAIPTVPAIRVPLVGRGGGGTASPAPREPRSTGPEVRRSLLRFLVGAGVALLLIGVGTVQVAQVVGRNEVLGNAERSASAIAHGIVAPMVDERARAGNPAALGRLAHVLTDRMADGTLVRVKIWTADGTVLWSDDDRLVGRTYDLPADVRAAMATQTSIVEFSELESLENVYEREHGELVEAYTGVIDDSGQPLLVETYMPITDVEATSDRMLRSLLPISLGSLLLFLLVLMPLALNLARRVDRAATERGELLRHAVAASALERRRIAGDLHDGVVQDLAGVGYALPAITSQLGKDPAHDRTRQALERVTGIVQRDLAALRAVITDIYPPDLREGGLGPALRQLAAHSRRSAGVDVDVTVDERPMPADATVLVYRVVREGLRNVVKHAKADRATVDVERGENWVSVRVEDDGVGFDGPPQGGEGHIGVRLLQDTIRDLGGTFRIVSASGRGTTLEAYFPVDWARG
jgi:signal transduction histidine kinase